MARAEPGWTLTLEDGTTEQVDVLVAASGHNAVEVAGNPPESRHAQLG